MTLDPFLLCAVSGCAFIMLLLRFPVVIKVLVSLKVLRTRTGQVVLCKSKRLLSRQDEEALLQSLRTISS